MELFSLCHCYVQGWRDLGGRDVSHWQVLGNSQSLPPAREWLERRCPVAELNHG